MNLIQHTIRSFAISVAVSAAAFIGARMIADAQSSVTFTTTTLDVSATGTGAEIQTSGTLIEANHFGGVSDGMVAYGGAVTLASGLTFGTSTAHMTAGISGTPPCWYPMHSSSSWSGSAAIVNAPFKALMSDVFWVAYGGSVSDLDIPGLTPGNTYRLQLISVSPQSASVVVEGSGPATWSGLNTVLTATWVQEYQTDTTANIALTRTAGEINFNAYALHDITPAGPRKDITSFVFPGIGSARFAGTNLTVSVPFGTVVTNLAPTFTLSAGATASPVSGATNDFTTPQTYTVTASDSTTKKYLVTVSIAPPTTGKDILSCTFGTLGSAAIIGTNITMSVTGNQPVTNLAPTFTLSTNATINPASGSVNDFTSPVAYTVTAQDGSRKAYLVTVLNYAAWQYSGVFNILTTPNGANLPASASVVNFPLLVRLNTNNFNFSQGQTNGGDIRFTTTNGLALAYQIEQWDPANGNAAVWVLIPAIQGNTNQPINMYWGKADALNLSSPANVFNTNNGYMSVFHLAEAVQDEVGTLTPVNSGTTLDTGIIGKCRHMAIGTGISGGDSITNYFYSTNAFTSECWFRYDDNAALGGYMVYFGRYAVRYNGSGDGDEVDLGVGSPASIGWASDGPAGATATTVPVLGQWYHVAAAYANGVGQIFVNGKLEGSRSGLMSLYNNIQMKIGGWRNSSYNFGGDIDEVRISSVARSTNWLWLEYQNQNPLQTLAGPLVQAGSTFSVSATNVTMLEGSTTNLVGQAGGAQNVYWILKQNGRSTVLASGQYTLNYAAGRVTGDQSFVLEFMAVYPTSIKTNDIAMTVQEYLPDPAYTLVPSATLWDGRQTLTVTPNLANWSTMQARGVTNLNYTWSVAGVAVVAQSTPGLGAPGTWTTPTLTLLRSQASGPLTVTLVLDNGGALITNTTTIAVQEPATDAWVQWTPSATEQPLNGQFYARDDTGFGTIYYNGTVTGSPTLVVLNVYANGVLYTNLSQPPSGSAYAFGARVPAGLVKYSVQFGTVTGTTTNLSTMVTNLVCGDAYVIDGQSNAVADNNDANPTNYPYITYYTNTWIRSYGNMSGGTGSGWGLAVCSSASGDAYRIGYWGMDIASNLVATYSIPICLINGAVGGTLISQHQADPANHYNTANNTYAIYGRILTRVAAARLNYGIRGVLWHQGENDSGTGDPTGDYDYKAYQQYFVNMSAAWKQDMPNLRRYYIYQMFPDPCGMGGNVVGDMLREVQRTLPRLYSNMSVMETIGGPNYGQGMCHWGIVGYSVMANNMAPLVARDNCGLVPSSDITAPDLVAAWFTTTNRNQIALQFSQNVAWNNNARGNLYLDNANNTSVSSGSASGNVIMLQLAGASTNQTISYLLAQYWNADTNSLIYGSNGIAALTFSSVPIAPAAVAPNAPAITSLLPVSGRTNGGTVVTLTGSNFLSGATVQFGGSSATAVTVNSATQVTATTPAHGPGLINVIVSNTNGPSATNQFTFVLPPAPATLGGVGQSSTNLVMVWAGGANQSCVLLSATNVAQPRSGWIPVATNAVGSNGLSTNRVPVSPGDPRRFYLLSIPYN